jgi:adenylate cyclase
MPRLQRDILLGFALICSLAISLMSSNLLRWADQSLYDSQTRWLRARAPSALPQDVVVIGLDEAAYESIPEPYALWHRHLGELLAGLAAAKPAVVGLATPLPVRSYEFLIKGIDAPLIEGIKRLRAAAPLVVGQPLGIGRQLRPIAPELLAAAGTGTVASLAICEDTDGTVRRIYQKRCVTEDKNEPFAHAMAKHMGRDGSPSGMIDYSAGGEIEYLPFREVLGWIRQGQAEQLKSRIQGRAVVVASLLPTETRYRLPVSLAAWERGSRTEPGAVAHVQALRSLLSRGLIERVSEPVSLVLAVLGALLWFGRNGWIKLTALLATGGAVVAGSTYAIWQGHYLHTGTLLAVVLMAFLARLTWESVRHYREKQLLRSAFAGHVSPQVMRAILGGALQPDADGERCKVTILFADIRGFTARSENSTPEATIALLNRYYAEASAAIHARGGAIDKFIGDGLMATFGVPQPLPAPERNALEAAQDMLVRIARLNTELVAEGLAPLEIGIGIHSGEVLAGYVGTRKRRDFTVIGDPVNTASRLESMSKAVGYPIVCSNDVAASVGFAGGMVDLGQQDIKGRSSLHVWGWNPPLAKRVKKARP